MGWLGRDLLVEMRHLGSSAVKRTWEEEETDCDLRRRE